MSEYPFTTLLRHGPVGQSTCSQDGTDERFTEHGQDTADVEAGDAFPTDESLPVVLVRLPFRPDPSSECAGPDSPYFLKVRVGRGSSA